MPGGPHRKDGIVAPLKTNNLAVIRPHAVRLLLPQFFAKSKDWRQERGLAFHIDDDDAFRTLLWVLERGKQYEVDVVILPELAVPETKIPLLQEWSLATKLRGYRREPLSRGG